MARADLYLSADVEADGAIPGPYSMSSFGLCVAGRYDGTDFTPIAPETATFYAELRPISDTFEPEAAAVSGLDREALVRDGRDPAEAMTACAAWVQAQGESFDARPVLVAYPLGYDWMWLYWYFVRFSATGSPFGHSGALDMKTFYAARSGAVLGRATKRSMPPALLSTRPHSHHALDDAMEQAELMQNLVTYRP